ncbi:MAG: (d)CMP kinase [Clostridiales bacterium]|nr:(d)CMP kinase [Clostridiales bacterium]
MSEEKKISVAIDGPSGAGKSTIAKMVSNRFGFVYVDTGAVYRTVGLFVKRAGVSPRSEQDVSGLLPSIHMDICYDDSGLQRMILGGEDVTESIREPEISRYASDVSALPSVRAFLLDMQRDVARKRSVVMDGRDIGTVVLPQADVKIFLTASAEERAKRRYLELCSKGVKTNYHDVYAQMKERDKNDSSRAISPLRPAKDSITIDTTQLGLEQSYEKVAGLIKKAACK